MSAEALAIIQTDNVTMIDGGGRTLMPGLIDMHWHSAYATIPMAIGLNTDLAYHTLLAAMANKEVLLRGFTMVREMDRYLDIGKHPWFALHVYSRKVMRWLMAVPQVIALLANLGLLHLPFFRLVLLAQLLFYAAAGLAFVLDRAGIRQNVLALPFYFCLVNAASFVGLVKALGGQRMAVWKTGRA